MRQADLKKSALPFVNRDVTRDDCSCWTFSKVSLPSCPLPHQTNEPIRLQLPHLARRHLSALGARVRGSASWRRWPIAFLCYFLPVRGYFFFQFFNTRGVFHYFGIYPGSYALSTNTWLFSKNTISPLSMSMGK